MALSWSPHYPFDRKAPDASQQERLKKVLKTEIVIRSRLRIVEKLEDFCGLARGLPEKVDAFFKDFLSKVKGGTAASTLLVDAPAGAREIFSGFWELLKRMHKEFKEVEGEKAPADAAMHVAELIEMHQKETRVKAGEIFRLFCTMLAHNKIPYGAEELDGSAATWVALGDRPYNDIDFCFEALLVEGATEEKLQEEEKQQAERKLKAEKKLQSKISTAAVEMLRRFLGYKVEAKSIWDWFFRGHAIQRTEKGIYLLYEVGSEGGGRFQWKVYLVNPARLECLPRRYVLGRDSFFVTLRKGDVTLGSYCAPLDTVIQKMASGEIISNNPSEVERGGLERYMLSTTDGDFARSPELVTIFYSTFQKQYKESQRMRALEEYAMQRRGNSDLYFFCYLLNFCHSLELLESEAVCQDFKSQMAIKMQTLNPSHPLLSAFRKGCASFPPAFVFAFFEAFLPLLEERPREEHEGRGCLRVTLEGEAACRAHWHLPTREGALQRFLDQWRALPTEMRSQGSLQAMIDDFFVSAAPSEKAVVMLMLGEVEELAQRWWELLSCCQWSEGWRGCLVFAEPFLKTHFPDEMLELFFSQVRELKTERVSFLPLAQAASLGLFLSNERLHPTAAYRLTKLEIQQERALELVVSSIRRLLTLDPVRFERTWNGCVAHGVFSYFKMSPAFMRQILAEALKCAKRHKKMEGDFFLLFLPQVLTFFSLEGAKKEEMPSGLFQMLLFSLKYACEAGHVELADSLWKVLQTAQAKSLISKPDYALALFLMARLELQQKKQTELLDLGMRQRIFEESTFCSSSLAREQLPLLVAQAAALKETTSVEKKERALELKKSQVLESLFSAGDAKAWERAALLFYEIYSDPQLRKESSSQLGVWLKQFNEAILSINPRIAISLLKAAALDLPARASWLSGRQLHLLVVGVVQQMNVEGKIVPSHIKLVYSFFPFLTEETLLCAAQLFCLSQEGEILASACQLLKTHLSKFVPYSEKFVYNVVIVLRNRIKQFTAKESLETYRWAIAHEIFKEHLELWMIALEGLLPQLVEGNLGAEVSLEEIKTMFKGPFSVDFKAKELSYYQGWKLLAQDPTPDKMCFLMEAVKNVLYRSSTVPSFAFEEAFYQAIVAMLKRHNSFLYKKILSVTLDAIRKDLVRANPQGEEICSALIRALITYKEDEQVVLDTTLFFDYTFFSHPIFSRTRGPEVFNEVVTALCTPPFSAQMLTKAIDYTLTEEALQAAKTGSETLILVSFLRLACYFFEYKFRNFEGKLRIDFFKRMEVILQIGERYMHSKERDRKITPYQRMLSHLYLFCHDVFCFDQREIAISPKRLEKILNVYEEYAKYESCATLVDFQFVQFWRYLIRLPVLDEEHAESHLKRLAALLCEELRHCQTACFINDITLPMMIILSKHGLVKEAGRIREVLEEVLEAQQISAEEIEALVRTQGELKIYSLGTPEIERVLFPESAGTPVYLTRNRAFGRSLTRLEASFAQVATEPGNGGCPLSSEAQETDS